jgi:hypothetical protein
MIKESGFEMGGKKRDKTNVDQSERFLKKNGR